jgi:four helix bundle protein
MKFEDLEAWQRARALVSDIYQLTREEILRMDFGLTGQIQRAAVSVMSNIAEGFERLHLSEKAQAYNIARASCGEVRSLLYVIEDNYPTHAAKAVELREKSDVVGRLVSGLIGANERRR